MIRRWSLVPIVTLLAVLAGCDPAPRGASGLPTGLAPGDPAAAVVVDGAGHAYTVVETASALHLPGVSALLDAAGGLLSLGGHTLSVPAGAVAVPTLFVMALRPDGRIEVELTALLPRLLRGFLDVGGDGFDRPVRLTLSYAGATNVRDPDGLVILHLREDGRAEVVLSAVDPEARTVTAELAHFSRYCMAIP